MIKTDTCVCLVFLFQNKYRAKGVEAFKNYSVVTETPVYETAKQNAQNLSDVSDFKCFLSLLILSHQIMTVKLIFFSCIPPAALPL